jgi:glutamate synthase (NADPH/NADH) small chain
VVLNAIRENSDTNFGYDAGRGQSLIVWAIAEGRAAASYVDAFLTGDTALPAPVKPTDRPLVV